MICSQRGDAARSPMLGKEVAGRSGLAGAWSYEAALGSRHAFLSTEVHYMHFTTLGLCLLTLRSESSAPSNCLDNFPSGCDALS